MTKPTEEMPLSRLLDVIKFKHFIVDLAPEGNEYLGLLARVWSLALRLQEGAVYEVNASRQESLAARPIERFQAIRQMLVQMLDDLEPTPSLLVKIALM